MTSPTTNEPTTTAQSDRGATIIDWVRIKSRYLAIGAAIVVVAGLGFWFYTRSAQIKNARAEQSLLQAKQAVMQGNDALAENDLQNVLKRYGSTRAGVEAGLVLAEIHYRKGDYQKGIEVLTNVRGKGPADDSQAKIAALIGDGQMQMGKTEEAIASYDRAAETARFDGGRAYYAARKARALQATGKADEARKVWEELASASWGQSVAPEARVRLGELRVQQARRS